MQSFQSFLSEDVSRTEARAKLDAIAQGRAVVPVGDIFAKTVDRKTLPFVQKDLQFEGPPTFVRVQPNILTATQRTVTVASVRYFLTQPPNSWFNSEIPIVVRVGTKHYLWDGHHRAAAALLLELRTIIVEFATV